MATTPNPNFPVITHAIWSEYPGPVIGSQIVDQATTMMQEGKTDGLVDIPDPIAPFDAYRNWLDTDAANEWVAFITSTGGPTLTSISIEP
jgi:hypothetical protein